jgi:hypothetical protein
MYDLYGLSHLILCAIYVAREKAQMKPVCLSNRIIQNLFEHVNLL